MNAKAAVLFPIAILAISLLYVLPMVGQAGSGIAEAFSELNVSAMQREYYPPVETLSSLPFSDHAMTGHADQKWNARTIAALMSTGGCRPRVYACPNRDFYVYHCTPPGEKFSVGLLVGLTVKTIITGFAASSGYWNDRCN